MYHLRFALLVLLISSFCLTSVYRVPLAQQSTEGEQTTADESDSSTDQAETDVAEAEDEEPTYTQDELDQIVSPVALYPDSLLTQVLVASTYPLDVVKGARWAEANQDLEGDKRTEEAQAQGWDTSVAVLAAGFPSVLKLMADDLDRTEQLGDALLVQSDDVLAAVQRMRARAAAVGNLESNEAQTVTVEEDQITIAPADPEVVYVPTYDSTKVYTEVAPAPVVVESSSGNYSTGDLVLTGVLAFGAGMIVNEIFSDNYWHGYWGPAYRPIGWGGAAFYPRPGRGGVWGNDVNVNVNNNITRNRVNVNNRQNINNRIDGGRGNQWKPDPRRQRDAQRDIANRKGKSLGGSGGNRPQLGQSRKDRERADLKNKLGSGGKKGNLAKPQNKGKLAKRSPGKGSAISGKKQSRSAANKAKSRGKVSNAKAKGNLGNRKAAAPRKSAPKKIARPKASSRPKAAKKQSRKGGAFKKQGGGKRAKANRSRGGKSARKLRR